jgi:transcriptional regulator with XRE-family HTH domain
MKSYIRQKRETKGWTQEELAAKVGVSVPTVSGWETGKSDISQKNLKKLAEVLDVTPTEIVAEKDLPQLGSEDKEYIANSFMALNEKVDDVEDNSFTLEDRVILATDIAKSAVGFAFIAIGIGIWGAFPHTKANLFISWFIPFMGVAFMIFGRAMIKIMERQLKERKIRKESRK